MGTFDDIFEGIDDLTAPEKPERDMLEVSEAEAKTGVWNAQDDGNVWTADNGPTGWTTQPSPSDPLNQGGMDIPEPAGRIREDDDWAREDDVLEDFVDEDDAYDGGGGAFDDLF